LEEMSDNKGGGSDLDIFEGLAKKSQRPGAPSLAPPQSLRGKTTVGMPPPPPPSSLPPLPGRAPAPVSTIPGIAPLPPPGAVPPPAPPPPPEAAAPALPAPAPPPTAAPASLPAPLPPPLSVAPKATGTLVGDGLPPLPPPAPPPPGPGATLLMESSPTSAGRPLPVPGLPPPSLPAPALPPPATPPPPPAAPTPASAGEKAGSLPPLPPPAKLSKGVEMDWDDEEESTHIYKEDGTPSLPPKKAAAAAALLASSGQAARPVSVPPPAPLPQTVLQTPPGVQQTVIGSVTPSVPPPPPIPSIPPPAAVPSMPPPSRQEETLIRPRPSLAPEAAPAPASKLPLILGAGGLVAALAFGAMTLIPKKGSLRIEVKTTAGKDVGKSEIYIDGKKACDTAPCVVSDLEAGSKVIKVVGPDFAAPDTKTELVEAGRERAVLITVEPTGAAVATTSPKPSTEATSAPVLKIAALGQEGVKVFIDGVEKGAATAALELTDLKAGKHTVRFDSDKIADTKPEKLYEPREETVELVAGQTKELAATKLKVLKGRIKLDVATSDADVKLVDQAKKVEKKVPSSLFNQPIDLNPGETWQVVATKKGFEDFTQAISFDDGNALRTIRVELSEKGKPAAPTGPVSTPTGPTPPATAAAPKDPPKDPPKEPASGNGTLNINSVPPSKVILDGKPLGSTPRVGVSVPAGTHTVTFIHPELGKKSTSVQVKAGETKSASVKFK
jgi:hypothetical protein